jgi:hypothetical protein
VQREFPGHFRNFVFMNARTIDAKCYGGQEELDRVRRRAEETLVYLVDFCANRGLAPKSYTVFGIDLIAELTDRVSYKAPAAVPVCRVVQRTFTSGRSQIRT